MNFNASDLVVWILILYQLPIAPTMEQVTTERIASISAPEPLEVARITEIMYHRRMIDPNAPLLIVPKPPR